MVSDSSKNAALEPGFFDGRFMVEIAEWDWGLYVGLSSGLMPVEHRFQGGLNYVRSIEILGRIRAPLVHRAKLMRIWISPFRSDMRFGDEGLDEVGQFYRGAGDVFGTSFQASLHLPEDALAPALSCLSSIWRFMDIWTVEDDPDDRGSVTAFTFSARIHPNLAEWAGPELEAR